MIWLAVPGGRRRHIFTKERGNCWNLVSLCGTTWANDRPLEPSQVPICGSCQRRNGMVRLRVL